MDKVSPQVKLLRNLESAGGSTTVGSFRGAEVTTYENPTVTSFYSVEEDFFQSLTVTNPSGNSDLTNYPTIRADGEFLGTDVVLFERNSYKRQLNLDFTSETIPASKSVTGLAEGDSYLQYSFDWLTGLLDIGGSVDVYSGGPRNAACWASSVDLTGIPYSNTSGGSQKNSAAITRQHLPGVKHFPMPVGTVITWKTAANVSVTRTVVGVSTSNAFTGDAIVYTLDSQLPESIKSYPVAGRWLFITDDSGPAFTVGNQFVSVFVNQDRKISWFQIAYYEAGTLAKQSGTISGETVTAAATTLHFGALLGDQKIPEMDDYQAFFIGSRVGDSGSAVFVPVASGLAIASVFTNYVSGPFMDENFMNALIASADADAIARGSLVSPTGLTVTVAADPTA
jgi:hypothetical protein